MANLTKMTDDELVAESQRLTAERETSDDAFRQQLREIKLEQDRRTAVESLREPLAALPEDQREAVIAAAIAAGRPEPPAPEVTEEDETDG